MVVDSPPGMMRPSRASRSAEDADEARSCAEGGERADVGVVGALQGEDADERRAGRGCGHFGELVEGLLAAGAGEVAAGAGAAAGAA